MGDDNCSVTNIMNVDDAIFGRRTIHSYEDTELSSETLRALINAAHQAPNHKLTWPWRFIIVGPRTRKALLPIAFELKNATTDAIRVKIGEKLLNPGGLVVVTCLRDDDPFREREDYAATCCAIQNLMLAAYARNLGTKWSTGGLTMHPKICSLLDIDSEKETVVGFIWVGTPSKVPTIERPPCSEHITEHP